MSGVGFFAQSGPLLGIRSLIGACIRTFSLRAEVHNWLRVSEFGEGAKSLFQTKLRKATATSLILPSRGRESMAFWIAAVRTCGAAPLRRRTEPQEGNDPQTTSATVVVARG